MRMRFHGFFMVMAAAGSIALSFSTASAFAPVREGASAERAVVPRLGGTLRMDPAPFAWADTELGAFHARHGGQWQVQWNEFTGTAHMVLGSGIAWTASPIASAADAEGAARRFIAESAELVGVPESELRTSDVVHAMGKWSVLFDQTYGGVRVVDGRAHVVLTDAGRLFAFGSDCHAGIALDTSPVVGEVSAVARAVEHTGYDPARDRIGERELVVLPVRGVSGLGYRLAHRVEVLVENPPGRWQAYVDASDGGVLWRYNEVRRAVSGTSAGDVQDFGYCDGIAPLALKNNKVVVVGQGNDTTDASGAWSVPVSGGGPFTVTAELDGPFANTINFNGTNAAFSSSAGEGTPLAIYWDDSNSRQDERDAFFHTNRVHDQMKAIDPAFTQMDYAAPVRVNRTDGFCPGNAWYDGNGINFCDSAGTFANTGEIGNVVYHEYGHGITDKLYGAGDPGGDLHEGNSDVVACYIQNVSIVGLGFFEGNCGSGIRDLDNELVYPDDLSGEGHHDGQIIGGFHWRAWNALRDALGDAPGSEHAFDIWHFGRKLGHPQTQPDQVTWTFIADDDDGNMANGTPFHALLCLAAVPHGFSCPAITEGVVIAHDPLTSTTNDAAPYPVTAVITSTEGALVTDSLRVFYQVNGGSMTELAMSPAGPPDTWTASIPAQSTGSEIHYYIRGRDVAGNAANDPPVAPFQLHRFGIALAFDNFEAASGWTVGAPGDLATGGIWVRANPVGTLVQPEDDHTPGSGTMCFVTGNGTPGGPIGEADVDGGRTTLLSPVYNLGGATGARLIYHRWYNNTSGAGPVQDVFRVDASNNGGSTWTNVETLGSNRRRWEFVDIDLAAHFPALDQVKVRFIASDTLLVSPVEAALDDFEVLAFEGATGVPVAPSTPGRPSLSYLAEARPNPFNPMTVIAYGLASGGPVDLRIFDVQGRLVRTLVNAAQPAGHYAFLWDARNEEGRAVPAGVYFSRLVAEGETRTGKMILAE